ncbi:DUF4190 domain-containing protein [Planomicrobium sp. Y74]|uniref:DUF4190 domain-containing protein n=1 Tax=Planomicrobium sp. Y74 TaxID=2478977 RepID=UPI000EF4C1F0|nr:DUF4190 domain-containing protein [Planomicrobium sp. Y74]RLQ91321.1 DUF4190 domain-containing protein [Planomicrobium sp. Y74]
MGENTPPDNSSVTNGKALGSLILGILSIPLPFFGLFFDIFSFVLPLCGIALGIFSIVLYRKAIVEMAWTGEGGRSIAIAGLNFSIVGIFIQLLMILGVIMFRSIF